MATPIEQLALQAASGDAAAGLVLPERKFVPAPSDPRKLPQWSQENHLAFLEWKDKLATLLQSQRL